MKFERIQILRLLAASAVLAFHAAGTLASRMVDPGTLWPLRFGYFGVDLFFVISGFIIHLTVQSRERSWRIFIRRRIIRIAPLYWLCTVVLFMLMPIFSRDVIPSISTLVRSILFIEWTSKPGAMPVIYLGWSLEYEVAFYVLVAAAIAFVTRPWLLVNLVLATLATTGAALRINHATNIFHFFLNPMLLEFSFGLLISEWLLRRQVPWRELVPILLATIAVLPLDWGRRVGIAGLPAAALVLAAAATDAHYPLRNSLARFLANMGDASYSIYLSQVFTISALARLGLMCTRFVPFDMIVGGILFVGLTAGWILNLYVEKPLLNFTGTRFGENQSKK